MLWQPMLGLVLMFFILFALGTVAQEKLIGAIGASSMASTVFIVMSAPSSTVAQFRHILGGYIIGIIVGVALYFFVYPLSGFTLLTLQHSLETCGAIAVGLSILCMVLLNCKHPPAAGMALGLVLEQWDYYTIATIILSIIMLSLIKRILRSKLMDLID